ncbi:MAG: ParB N-terminal domain-containing protein [Rhodobacteraceae bacterium]|nr:ParB N-terminal domain-containing protein [Paracoccaceae bacterium]
MNDSIAQPSDVSLKEATKVSVDWLKLDRKNPRLVGSGMIVSDAAIISELYRGEELSELLQSFASNGYLDIEPLIVKLNDGAFTVLEGNRRLAAIKLFRDEHLADEVFRVGKIRIKIPNISEENRATLEAVSIYRVANREDARAYIGFKHINGAAKWESFAKARFAANWYKTGEASLITIAEKIGDSHNTIKRMVNAIYVLDQATATGQFDLSDRFAPRFNFSHLYTALSRRQYMEFLDLGAAWTSYDPQPNPIDRDKITSLLEVLRWIYGSKEEDREPVIKSQNPDIKNLGQVLLNGEGITVLRKTNSLSEAMASIVPPSQRLSESLLEARSAIRDATNSLRGFDGQDQALIDIAEDVSESAQTVHQRMRKKKAELHA